MIESDVHPASLAIYHITVTPVLHNAYRYPKRYYLLDPQKVYHISKFVVSKFLLLYNIDPYQNLVPILHHLPGIYPTFVRIHFSMLYTIPASILGSNGKPALLIAASKEKAVTIHV
jgi:hypothetical protein